MKAKITILLIAFFVLALSSQMIAQTKPVAYIIGAETQSTYSTTPPRVESFLVQLNGNLIDPTLSWTSGEWDLVLGDFKILDGVTLIPVTSAAVGAQDNWIILTFDFNTYQFDVDKSDLKLHYSNLSGIAITTENGNLQNTTTAVNIDDGIAPILKDYTIESDNANPYLGEAGDVVTFEFTSYEALATIPEAPQVTFTVPELKYSTTVEATTSDSTQLVWSAEFTIPAPGSNLDGKVTVSSSFWDVHANAGSLAATDTGSDGSFVTVKNYDPTYTYVGAGFDATTLPDPVTGDDDDIIFLWNVFNTVQEAIDAVASGGSVNVTTGTYNEDLTINTTLELLPYEAAVKAYDVVTLKGVATVAATSWPLAAPNIDIQATGVSIHDFNIEAPDYVVGFYSSGIVVGATNATIYNNNFYATSASNTDDICQSIQTYNGVDISGLNIYTNTFTHKTGGIVGDWGYEGIYINPGGTGLVNIEDNTFGGKLFRGITVQRSNCNVEANTIGTDLVPVADDWSTAGAWVGIWAWDDISDVIITGNTVQGTVGGTGFNRGIRLGSNAGSTFTNLSVTSNEIYYNKNGIYSQSATGITITGNAIENNTAYGIFCDTGTLNAENNWWGSANGPDHADNTFNVTAQGDASSDHVDYVPWYDSDMTSSPFAPIVVDDGAKALTYFSSFQTAIDAATGGETISARSGYFDEQFTVDVANLTFQSYPGDTAIIQPTAAPVAGIYDVQIFASNTIMTDLEFDFGDRESVFTGIAVGEYDEILCPAEVTGVEILLNDFYGDGTMIQTGYTIDISDLLIDENNFYLDIDDGTTDGAEGIYVSPFPYSKGVGVTISDNHFEGYVDYGIAVDASHVTVSGNYIDSEATVERAFIRYIDWYGNDNTDVLIESNEMYDISTGIWVESYHDPLGSLSGTIQYNTFDGCDVGIHLAAGLTTSLEITQNDFTDGLLKGRITAINNTTTVLADCESNWFDSVNGPDHAGNTFNVDAQGLPVTDYVDYVPWLNASYATGVDFAPVELSAPAKQAIDPYYSSIQAAIDAASAGYEIFCYAGTFTEDFVVDVGVSLEGENVKQAVTLLGEQEVTASNVSFNLFEFDPGGAGTALLVNSSGGPIDNLDITYCEFTLTTSPSVGVYIGGGSSPQAISDVYMVANKFFGPDDKICNPWKIGGSFGNNVSCKVTGLEFSNNEVNKGSIPVNLVNENIDDLYISYNDFFDTDGVIYFWNDSGTPPSGVLSNFQFSNNYVPSSNSYGIAIGGAALGGPIFTDTNFGDGIEIYDNAFEMSGTTYGYGAVYMADQYTDLLNASNNWWGDQYGPENDNNTYTPPAPLKGRATVSDRVEFAPWYNLGTDGEPGRGWAPDASAELFAPVHNVTQDTYHSSIQRAVDGATAGDVLQCIDGTFTEDIVVNTANLTLKSTTGRDNTKIQGVDGYVITLNAGATNFTLGGLGGAGYGFEVVGHETNSTVLIETIGAPSGVKILRNFLNGYGLDNQGTNMILAVGSGGISGLELRYNTIYPYRGAGYGNTILYFDNNTIDSLIVANNTIVSKRGHAKFINCLETASMTNATIQNNNIWYCTLALRMDGRTTALDNIEIKDNNFKGACIFVGPGAATGEVLSNLSITGNTLTTHSYYNDNPFFEILGPTAANIDWNTVELHYNDFSLPSTQYAVKNNVAGTSLNAEKNWWGDATGPVNALNPHSPKGYGDGSSVSDNVDFIPWYATSTVTTTTEYVMTHSDVLKAIVPLAYADAIQPCIDATAGDYYWVKVTSADSPYDEDLVVDRKAHIYGYDITKTGPSVQITGTHEVTANDVTFDELILTPGTGVSGTVITINSTSQIIDNTTITTCQFDMDTSPSIGIYIGGSTPTNAVNNTTIDNTTFNGPTDMLSNPFKVGGSYGSPVGCEIGGLTFEYNYVNYGSIPINIADKNVDLTVQYNTFANTDGVIYFWAEDVVKSPTGEITEFQFNNNYVDSTNSYGVGFDMFGNFTSANYGGDIHIYENYFDAAIPGLVVPAGTFNAVSILTPTVDLAGYVIDAANNWWGSEDGPSHSSNTFNVPTQGVAVSDNVSFVQWYDSGDAYADPGWSPSGSLFAPVTTAVKVSSGYASIQAAIDASSSGSEILCHGAPSNAIGTFYEDFSVPSGKGLTIHPYNSMKAYDDVTIKGQTIVPAASWPLADPNIEILGNGTTIEGFTIEAPDYVEGYYSSGICVGALGAFIQYNDFVMNSVNTTGDISQAIQTYKDVDCSTLNIRYNTFDDNLAKGPWGYEAIYINPNTGVTWIEGNTFTGRCLRAVTIDDNSSTQTIYDNTIETTMIPWVDWSTAGAYQGINLVGDLGTVFVQDNYIGGTSSSYGFAQGIRVGYDDEDTFTNISIGYTDNTRPNEISYNTYGILVKSATNVTINYNIIDGNDFGIQNDDTGAKAVLDATYNYWGAIDGPSWTFDYGMGSGSGDEVSEYVDFTPWYEDDALTTLYDVTMAQYLLQINPATPYVDNYFDLRVCAADANGIRDFTYNGLADFSSSNVALTVPQSQLLADGFIEVPDGCISAEAFEAADNLSIYAWEYGTNNNPQYYSTLSPIVILEKNDPAPPTNVSFYDVPNDNGGWIYVDYTLSIDDPFYTTVKDTSYGVSYYVVEIDTAIASGVPDWNFLATIACYDDSSGTNNYTALLPAPASDTAYNFRMASVYNPTKLGGFDENHISYEEIVLKDSGAQSTWQYGSAAPMDNLPAYANFTVFMEGPYNVTNHNMDALNSFIPLSSPYDGETVSSLPAGTVDWLQIQLRSAPDGSTVKSANAFLLSDGSIVDVDGNHSLPFYYTTGIDYYIVISHRNHLDIMTATGKAFGDTEGEATDINLSVAGSVYGNGFKEVETDVYAMYAGDANDNGQVQNDDLYDYWSNQVGQGGYLEADFNLNGQVQNDDRYDYWRYNVGHGSSVPGGSKNSGDNGSSSQGEKTTGITFTFANGILSGGYYEFDVMVAGSAEGTKLGSNQTYVNYSTTGFGENIATNGKITVTKGSLIIQEAWAGQELYEITNVVDNTSSRIAITVTLLYANFPSASDLLTTPSQLLHVKIEIANPAATSDLCFEQSLMATQQYESDNSTKYDPVNVGPCLIQTLPVELSAFTALYNVEKDDVMIKWTTASETDVQGFNIYRSEYDDISTAGNHINYSLISLPETGTSTNPIDYSFEDIVANVYSPYYYWLEVVDYGGTSSFYGSIVYTPGDITGDDTPDVYDATQLIGACPNPVHNYTTIKYQLSGSVLEQNATIRVYNILGKCVKTVEGRNGKVELDVSDLGSGIYFYQLKTSNYNVVKKLIVIK